MPPSPTSRGITSAALWTLVGVGFAVGCHAGVVVVLARLAPPEALADYALTMAVGAPIWIFVGLQLPALKATDVRARFSLHEYLAVRLVSALIGTVATCAVTMATGATDGRALTVVAVSLWRAADFTAELGYAELQLRGRADLQAKAQILRGVLGIAGFTTVLAVLRTAATSFAALALISVVILAFWDFFNLRRTSQGQVLYPIFRRRTWGLVRWGLPLGVVVVLAALTANIPRYSIEAWLGHAVLGGYSAIATLAAVGTVAISALNQVASPRVARAWDAGDMRSARRYLTGLLAVSAVIGGVATTAVVFIGNPTLVFVFGPRFANQQTLMVILFAGATLTCATSSLGAAATAFRAVRPQVAINFATLCVAAGAAPVLVRRYGLEGAAASQVISGLCALALFAALVGAAMKRQASRNRSGEFTGTPLEAGSELQFLG